MAVVADDPGRDRRVSLVLPAVLVYALFLGAGYGWLWLRDRTAEIPGAATGELGLWGSAATGAAVGLAVSGALALIARYAPPFARLRVRLMELIGPLTEIEVFALALLPAVAEEFFFRMAAQDAIGWLPAALLFAAMHFGPRGTRLWTVLALIFGVGFGLMVVAGWGLLSVTVAHALVNYISLKRMES